VEPLPRSAQLRRTQRHRRLRQIRTARAASPRRRWQRKRLGLRNPARTLRSWRMKRLRLIVTETHPDDRRARAVKLVERFSSWSGAAGLIPVPFVDLAAIGGVQIQMLRRISQIYGVPFAENRGKALIAGLAGSMIPASSGIGAASILKSVSLDGTAISAFAMPALSAGATYAI